MHENELLKAYAEINQNLENPLIKILVSYIKPSCLFKTDILTPIHLGRAVEREISKDGVLKDEDIQWLHENCIGDDDFEGNISSVNRGIGFLTGTYWAWKNYEKLGNPEYFGSMGYRRLFEPSFLSELKQYDMILPKRDIQRPSLKEYFISSHGKNIYQAMMDIFSCKYPHEFYEYEKYLSNDSGYMFEIYVLKKNLFFEFCEWIFPLVFEFMKLDDDELLPKGEERKAIIEFFKQQTVIFESEALFELYQKRAKAFALERLTGFFLYLLVQRKYSYSEQNVIILNNSAKANLFKMLRNKIGKKNG